MKKLFVASALALALTMASQQTASAWSEVKFGVGLNFGWVGGGNRVLFGVYRSAPYPGGPDLAPLRPLAPVYAPAAYGGGFEFTPPAGPAWEGPTPGHAEAYPMPSAPAVPAYYSGYQPVGNSFPGSYYQAPTSWYGR